MTSRIITLVIIQCFVFFTFSQDSLRSYFNKKWKDTTIEAHVFYRDAIKENDGTWIIKDYYKSGKVQMLGKYLEKEMKTKVGTFTYYYESGGISSIHHFKKNVTMDSITRYHENGSLQEIEYYENGKINGINRGWYSSGEKSYVKYFSEGKSDGEFLYYWRDGAIKSKENFKGGKREGESIWYSRKGSITCKLLYDSGDLKKKSHFMSDGSRLKVKKNTIEHTEYPGGYPALAKFIQKNIIYPKNAKRKKLEGKVFVSFLVNTDGSLSEIKAIKSPGDVLSKEAERVIQLMPDWKPHFFYARPMGARYTVPINFKL